MLQEYGIEMTDLWGAVGMVEDTELNGLDLSDTHWKYGGPTVATCPDIWDLWILTNLLN